MMSVTVTVTVDKRLTCVDRDTVSVGEHIKKFPSTKFWLAKKDGYFVYCGWEDYFRRNMDFY